MPQEMHHYASGNTSGMHGDGKEPVRYGKFDAATDSFRRPPEVSRSVPLRDYDGGACRGEKACMFSRGECGMKESDFEALYTIFDDIECLAVTAQSELSRYSLLADLATWIKNRAERMAA